jgi:hypothetical protein
MHALTASIAFAAFAAAISTTPASQPNQSTVPGNVACASYVKDAAAPGNCLTASSVPTLGSLYPLTSSLFVSPQGKVGIGTTTPGRELEVVGGITAATYQVGANFRLRENAGNWGARTSEFYFAPTTGEDSRIVFFGNNSSTMDVIVNDGRLGVGTANPDRPLHVVGNGVVEGQLSIERTGDEAILLELETERSWEFRQEGSGASTALKLRSVGGGAGGVSNKNFLIETTGRVGIGTLAPAATLDVNGETATDSLIIRGGSDLAERWEGAEERLKPGTLVVLDETRIGGVAASSAPYDRKVIGVVSGAGGVNPGLVLGQEQVLDGDTIVATCGRVYVECTAENGAIAMGDMLTTASLAGHAMKATDRDRAFGSVFGKAASSLADGTGLVLVVLTLQ